MRNVCSIWAFFHIFDSCIAYNKSINVFECKEISESIYKEVVEKPSRKKAGF